MYLRVIFFFGKFKPTYVSFRRFCTVHPRSEFRAARRSWRPKPPMDLARHRQHRHLPTDVLPLTRRGSWPATVFYSTSETGKKISYALITIRPFTWGYFMFRDRFPSKDPSWVGVNDFISNWIFAIYYPLTRAEFRTRTAWFLCWLGNQFALNVLRVTSIGKRRVLPIFLTLQIFYFLYLSTFYLHVCIAGHIR